MTIARMERAFRDGAKDEAIFHRIEEGRLILARFHGLCGSEEAYRGMLETMQDITDIRATLDPQRKPD